MMMDFREMAKISERGVIGWIEDKEPTHVLNKTSNNYVQLSKERQVLRLINLENQNFRFIDEEIKGYKKDVTEVPNDFKIIRIFELIPDVYLCQSNQSISLQFWILDTRILNETGCMRRVWGHRQNNLELFDYNSYNFKAFGPFAVLKSQSSNYTLISPEVSISLCTFSPPLTKIIHNSTVCMYSYKWSLSKR